jgi:hypothetical protein
MIISPRLLVIDQTRSAVILRARDTRDLGTFGQENGPIPSRQKDSGQIKKNVPGHSLLSVLLLGTARCLLLLSSDHPIRSCQHIRRNGKADLFRRLEIVIRLGSARFSGAQNISGGRFSRPDD